METKGRNGGRIGSQFFFVEGDGIDGMILSICVFFLLLLMKNLGSREMLGDGSVDIR